MKIAPVSGDLMVKLAVGVLVVGVVYYAAKKASDSVSSIADKVFSTAQGAVDTIKNAADSVSLNTTLPDSAYSDPAAQEQAAAALGQGGGDNLFMYYWHKLSPPASTGGATGGW